MLKQVTTMLGTVELIERTEPHEYVMLDVGYQPFLEREVVIHRLDPSMVTDPRLRGRFIKEARTLASLHHHNIVRVYDAGTHDDQPYVVLEQLEGVTLQQRLDQLLGQRERMDAREAVRFVRSVAEAVEYAHQHGILVHNVTAGNIVLTTDGRTVLASLGERLPENRLAASPATLAYASPERLFGGPIDGRSDVYALGVLLYHLLFGRLPFEGNASGIIMQKQNAAILPPLDNPHAELPCAYALVHVMRQAAARDPENRYSSVRALFDALESALDGHPVKFKMRPRISMAVMKRMQVRRLERAMRGTELRALPDAEAGLSVGESEELLLERAVGEAVSYAPPRARTRPPAWTEARPVHSATATETVEEEAELQRMIPQPIEVALIDPLMPGRDVPELQLALPYTLLVPMPDAEEQQRENQHQQIAVAATVLPERLFYNHLWVIGMILLALLAIGAAMQFGQPL